MSAGLRGGKKHREIVGKNKSKQDRKQQISPSHSSLVLSVFLPSSLALPSTLRILLGVLLSLALPSLSDGHGGSDGPYLSLPPAPGEERAGR